MDGDVGASPLARPATQLPLFGKMVCCAATSGSQNPIALQIKAGAGDSPETCRLAASSFKSKFFAS